MDRHEYERKHGQLRDMERFAQDILQKLQTGSYEPAVMDKVRFVMQRAQLIHSAAKSAIAELDAEHRKT